MRGLTFLALGFANLIASGLVLRKLGGVQRNTEKGLSMSEDLKAELEAGLTTLENDAVTLKTNSDLAQVALDDLLAKVTSGTAITADDIRKLQELHGSISDAATALHSKVIEDDPSVAGEDTGTAPEAA